MRHDWSTVQCFLRSVLRDALGTSLVFLDEEEARKEAEAWEASVREDWDATIREERLPDGVLLLEGRASGPFARYGEPYQGETSVRRLWAALPQRHPLRPVVRALRELEQLERELKALPLRERRRWLQMAEESLRQGGAERLAEVVWASWRLRRLFYGL